MQEIVCAVCGRRTALAPGSAKACPSCGAPITAPAPASSVDDDSATRPVIPPAPETPKTPEQPKVPDATDATDATDGATQVAMPVGTTEAGESTSPGQVTADYPMPPTPERTQTVPPAAMPDTESQARRGDTPVAWPVSPSAPPEEVPVASRKRSPFALISILLLILLLLVIGAAAILLANGQLPFFGATPKPTTAATATLAPTATPTSILTTFTDAGNVFSIGYPKGWLETIQNNQAAKLRLVIFSNPSSGANFNVGTYAATDVSAQQVVDTTLGVLSQKTGIANQSGPTSMFIAGQLWTQKSGDVTVTLSGQSKPTAMHAVVLATIRGNNTIYVLELAPVDTFADAEPTFQQMLQSLMFLH